MIRCGIITDDLVVSEWQFASLQHLLALEQLDVVAVIVERREVSRQGPLTPMTAPLRWLARVVPAKHTLTSMRVRSLRELLGDCPHWHVAPNTADERVDLDATILDDLRAADLDFILDFGWLRDRSSLSAAARFGVWRFQHDSDPTGPGSQFWWELYDGKAVIGTRLLRLTSDASAPIVLKEGCVEALGFAYRRSVDTLLFECARWPAQLCVDVRNSLTARFNAEPTPLPEAKRSRPHALQRLRFRAIIARNIGRKALVKLFRHDQWRVGVLNAPIDTVLEPARALTPSWLAWPRGGEFVADPFGVTRGQEVIILCETLDYAVNRGVIEQLVPQSDGSFQRHRVAIGPDVHLSYPYLLEYNEEVYCLPETHQAREIAIYRARAFPTDWEKVRTLIHGLAGLDPTIFQFDGVWWLACTDHRDGPNRNLFLWYAAELLGSWRPHPANPVKTDPRSARPAGTPFVVDGQLYRPAQDCSRTYGGGITLNRVTKLTPLEFAEEPAAAITPADLGAEYTGVHTISSVGRVTLIDAKRTRFVPSAFLRTLRASARLMSQSFRHTARASVDVARFDPPEQNDAL